MIAITPEINAIKTILSFIFDYYNHNFKLDIRLDFTDRENNCSYIQDVGIDIGIGYLLRTYNDEESRARHNYNSLMEYSIIILLHEIGHAIDFKYNYKDYIEKHWDMLEKYNRGKVNRKNYAQLPLERRADYFANHEKERWIK